MSCHLLFSSKTPPLNTPTHSKISLFPITSTKQCTNFNNNNNNTRETRGAPISVNYPSIIPSQLPSSFNVDYLKSEFECEGVSFKDLAIGESYVMKMVLDNGSAASVVLPAGLITSYKPKMWHGTSVEVLHTNVSQDLAGTPVILGGLSFLLEVFADDNNNDDFSWRPQHWLLNAVRGSSQDSIQVEMVSRDVSGMVEAKHILSLQDDTLTSEISISNLKCSQVKMRGSILSHLNVSTPEATYAFGLEGSDFSDREPLNSNFCIIPPEIQKSKQPQQQTGSRQLWPFKDLFSPKNEIIEVEMEGEEGENYKHLSSKMSRIYTYAPRNFTIIDRGKRNSVSVGRKGFEEVYLYSPGSTHESYGKYSYICVGSSALLKPVTLAPQQIWTGKQILHNPNL